MEYPKALYKDLSDMCVVLDDKEEGQSRKEGYKDFADVRAMYDDELKPIEAKPAKAKKAAE
jgi:hypothetical protein